MNPLKKTGIYGAMRRYYHASETFLWRERSPDNGELVSMTKIDIVYDTVTDGVRGIRFNYERGFKKEFGLMNGDVYTLQLTQHQDEKISLLVARRITDGHYGMEVCCTLLTKLSSIILTHLAAYYYGSDLPGNTARKGRL